MPHSQTNESVRTLNEHIAGGLTKDYDASYLLGQLRKLVKREQPQPDYPVADNRQIISALVRCDQSACWLNTFLNPKASAATGR